MNYDLIIIGGGAGGLTIASAASQLGLQVALFEKNKDLGGDCLHTGCVPSKTLIASAKTAYLIKNADAFGLESPEITVDMAKINQHVQDIIDKIQLHDDPKRFESYGCTIYFGTVAFNDAHSVILNNKIYTAKKIVIACGSSPVIPAIPGLIDTEYFTNETIFHLTQLPKKLIILGAGAIGIEMAQAFSRLGSEVTVIEMLDKILPMADQEVISQWHDYLCQEGISFHFGTAIKKIENIHHEKIITCQKKDEKPFTINGDALLIATGRKPNIGSLSLEKAEIQVTPKGITVNARLQTSQKHIFAIGDVTDCPYKLTHVAEYHASIVIANCLFKIPSKCHYQNIPIVIFTDPELAMVGLTELQASQLGYHTDTLRFSFADIDRAQAENQAIGSVKLVISNGKILGVTIFGPHAGELIHEFVLAMQAGLKIGTISKTIHAYPTLSQINRKVVNTYYAPKLFSPRIKKIVQWLNKLPFNF